MPIETIHGIAVHFEVRGNGEPLLFIHGLGSSARDWAYQLRSFSPRYKVVTYDVRGHGSSEKAPGPYSIELFSEDAKGLLDHLGISSTHVVGISMGGMIAFQLAVDYPSLVRSMVIVNSGPELQPRSLRERLQVMQRYLIVRLLGMRKMAEFLAPRLFPEERHGSIRREFIERWSANDTGAYLASMTALMGWGVADRIGEVEIPTLFVSADRDYTPVETKVSYARKMPNARVVVIENSRHATPIERPRAFNRVIGEFLDQRGSDPTLVTSR